MARLRTAGFQVSAVLNHYSLLNRFSEESGILDHCRANDIVFYGYMTLQQIAVITAELKKVAEAHGVSAAQIARAYAVSKGVYEAGMIKGTPAMQEAYEMGKQV